MDMILSGARVADKGLSRFSITFPTMAKLQYLDLSCNAITDVGAKAFSNSLAICGPRSLLTRVNVAYNRIGKDGIIELIAAAYANNKLTHLWLQGNKLSREERKDVEAYYESAAVNKIASDETDSINHSVRLEKYHEMRKEKGLANDDYADKLPNLAPRSEKIEVFL